MAADITIKRFDDLDNYGGSSSMRDAAFGVTAWG